MKTIRILSIAMTLAMVMIAGLHASVIEHQPPAPLPEFKTPEQLAKWRAEQNQKIQSAPSSQEGRVFYTGKPYLAESGSYAFKYREYNPEMGRWTTVDPSGFPDGANNRIYSTDPVNGFDSTGQSWTDADFLYWFYAGGGQSVNIDSIGLLESVQNLANAEGIGGVAKFKEQIAGTAKSKAPYNGTLTDSFNKSYPFGSIVWAMGGGVLSGTFSGNMSSTWNQDGNGGTYSYSGKANINYSDTFEDPVGVIEHIYGSSSSPNAPDWLKNIGNLGGTPYSIVGVWNVTTSGQGAFKE